MPAIGDLGIISAGTFGALGTYHGYVHQRREARQSYTRRHDLFMAFLLGVIVASCVLFADIFIIHGWDQWQIF